MDFCLFKSSLAVLDFLCILLREIKHMNSHKNRTNEFPSVFLVKVEDLRFCFCELYAEDVLL